MSERVRLIVNVDDYGWSAGVNEAVCRLYDEGVVTSTSLMVAGPALADGLARLEERPRLAVGLHAVLVAAPAVLPRREIPHLVDEKGWFPGSNVRAALRLQLHPGCRAELGRELEAQFAAFARLGLPWSHVDSHRHLAITPAFFEALLPLCRRYPVVGYRVPLDDYGLFRRMEPRAKSQNGIDFWFRRLCAAQRPRVEAVGLVTTRRCYGLYRTGKLTADYLARLIAETPAGDFELHCHPDLSTEKGRAEYEALRSPVFRRALDERNVELTTYAGLQT